MVELVNTRLFLSTQLVEQTQITFCNIAQCSLQKEYILNYILLWDLCSSCPTKIIELGKYLHTVIRYTYRCIPYMYTMSGDWKNDVAHAVKTGDVTLLEELLQNTEHRMLDFYIENK